jgi:hypothetical protein
MILAHLLDLSFTDFDLIKRFNRGLISHHRLSRLRFRPGGCVAAIIVKRRIAGQAPITKIVNYRDTYSPISRRH